jgi:hypothetical protein
VEDQEEVADLKPSKDHVDGLEDKFDQKHNLA